MKNLLVKSSQEGFDSLNLISPICRAVDEEKYQTPTPIQYQAIPHLLRNRDLLGCAQTGTGKTAAFALPILQRLTKNQSAPGAKGIRVLVLAPTRELAVQIDESFRVYSRYLNISRALVYGGVKARSQIRSLRRGVDVLVATPGRLLDLFNQGQLRLDKVETLVLDEADRMLDMGFLPDIRKIVAATPAQRQSVLFSATLPKAIRHLTGAFLRNPIQVSVTPPSRTAANIDQRILFVDRTNKRALLESLLQDHNVERVLVFARTKHGANKISKNLNRNRLRADALHGNKSQSARLKSLDKFRSGETRVLVATDIASRGLDIDGITHVINYELPMEPENYVHRIGRTARAGNQGVAISFCDATERPYLEKIQKEINLVVNVDTAHPFHSKQIAAMRKPSNVVRRNNKKSRPNGSRPRVLFGGKN